MTRNADLDSQNLRRSITAYLNARSELRAATTTREKKAADIRMTAARAAVGRNLRLASPDDKRYKLALEIVAGDGRILRFLEAPARVIPETRPEVRALTLDAISHSDVALRGTPGTKVVRCNIPECGATEHIRWTKRGTTRAS
jgi:hypothetical protein